MTQEMCIVCGEVIPEGRMVCPLCEKGCLPQTKKKTGWQYRRYSIPLGKTENNGKTCTGGSD